MRGGVRVGADSVCGGQEGERKQVHAGDETAGLLLEEKKDFILQKAKEGNEKEGINIKKSENQRKFDRTFSFKQFGPG